MAGAGRQLPEEFQRLTLTPAEFHTFYNTFMRVRFPLDVAEVLDLRYLINHAVDDFIEPSLTPDYRQFCESLERALDSFSIDDQRHRERLLKILAMFRELHVAHALLSRTSEERLRTAMDDNRHTRRTAIRAGLAYLFVTALSVIGWYAVPEIEWPAKFFALLCAVQAWKNFHALPRFDRQILVLRNQLNELLRQRIESMNWKTLIHKLALVLGYKTIKGVEVFRMDSELSEFSGPYH